MKYFIENNAYSLISNDDLLLSGMPEVGLALEITVEDGETTVMMHKHGDPKLVSAWAVNAKKRYMEAGLQFIADDIKVFTGQFPITELNKMIENTSYPKCFYQKLMNNEIGRELEVIPMDPVDGLSF